MTTKSNIEQLFKTHYSRLFRLAILILRDDEAARDIEHDVFAALLTAGTDDITEAYLTAAVRNRCFNFRRNLSTADRLREMYSTEISETEPDEEWPDEALLEIVRVTVAADLGYTCRRVVEMRFTLGYTYQQIADELGISKVAVYKHLRHTIDVLRKKLSANG